MAKQAEREETVKREKTILTTAALLAVIVIILILSTKTKEKRTEPVLIAQEVVAAAEEVEEEETEAEGTAEKDDYRNTYPFNTIPSDWENDDAEDFVCYSIPEEYSRYGGVLPEIVQMYTYSLCNQNGIDYETILAMIEYESGYKWDARSEAGALGYMQIMQKWHTDRMQNLGVYDIENPYQNIETGIDIMREMLEKYENNYEKALTAYHWGPTGAQQRFFSAGQDGCEYSDSVLEIAKRIRSELESGQE
jgi:hypothetical protein